MIKVIEVLEKRFPGGWKNIRSMHLKTEKSMSIPLYLSEGKTQNTIFCTVIAGGSLVIIRLMPASLVIKS
jgi:hypothetical protein